jgi:Ca-activated chloride channel family protein
VEAGKTGEAIREASKLRRDGLASPRVLETLCDLQAGAGRVEEAKRTCSELVEFNAEDPGARQRLGDIFLRHGWYEAAYRQYAGLVAMIAESPFAFLRRAAAAAGMGKVDEALRIERKVASGDGEPGPTDPRRFARLHSAARLARMLLEAREKNNNKNVKAIERSLKQTQVFSAESTVVLLVWEDLQSALSLLPKVGGETYTVSEQVVSPDTGLFMIDIGRTPPKNLDLKVAPNKSQKRRVPYTLFTISFDGKTFGVEALEGVVDPAAQNV